MGAGTGVLLAPSLAFPPPLPGKPAAPAHCPQLRCAPDLLTVPRLPLASEQVLLRARPTVSTSDLGVFEKFTDEFGEEAS